MGKRGNKGNRAGKRSSHPSFLNCIFPGLVPFLYILLAVTGCQFEGDEALIPTTRVSYLVLRTEVGHRIIRQDANGINTNWQSELGFIESSTGGLDGNTEYLWVGGAQALWKCTPSGELLETIELGEFDPHLIKVGEKTLLLCDTTQGKLIFMDLKSENLIHRDLDGVNGQPRYLGGQFYVPADKKVWIYQELAYAVLDSVTFSNRVLGLQPDQRARIEVYTGNRDSLLLTLLDYNSHQILSVEKAANYRKRRISPYRQAYFGKELTTAKALGTHNQFGTQRGIVDFEYDFFDRRAFLLQGDTLLVLDELAGSVEKQYLGRGSWLHSWYHQGAMAE